MARPTWPTPGTRGWDSQAVAGWNDISDRADLALSTASGASATPGGVLLDSFSGANDDAKLTAAMSYAAAQTVKPAIYIGNRQYSFSQTNRSLYSGFKMIGLGGFGDQQRAANSIPNDIRFTGAGTWFTNPGTTYDVEFRGLCLQGNSNGQFIASNPGVLWTSKFSDLGFNLWKNVFGNDSSLSSTKFLNTACLWTGWGNINNSYGTACSFGGSDSKFFTGGQWLIDSPPSIMAAGKYHVIFDYQEESTVGGVYMTAEQSGGVLINGGATTKGLRFTGGFDIEGRNSGQPCYGSLVRINGGGVSFRDCWFAYGASSLNANGRSGELGVITVAGSNADVLIDGCWYDRAVAESVKFVGISSGSVRIRNIMRGAKGGSWSGLPQVSSAANSDDSVTEV
jgi:hypothetical protein